MKAIAATLVMLLTPIAAHAEQPTVGDIFDPQWDSDKPTVFRGWTVLGRSTANTPWGATVFIDNLTKGHRYLIAITEPVKGDIAKIIKLVPATAASSEIQPSVCSFADLATPVLALLDQEKGIARGFFLVGNEIAERRWFIDVPSAECYFEPE